MEFDYYTQIFIDPKGFQIHKNQWKENLLIYLTEHQDGLIFYKKFMVYK